MKWLDSKQIQITPPKRTKKVTGTRFATILGLNPWSTPFEMWCAITKTYEKPFEDTIYTIAGKTIEPKQAEYMKKSYFMTNIVTPTDIYGEDDSAALCLAKYYIKASEADKSDALLVKLQNQKSKEYYLTKVDWYNKFGNDRHYVIATLLDAVAEHPTWAKAHLMLGLSYYEREDNTSAIYYLKKAHLLDSSDGYSLCYLGVIYYDRGSYKAAEEYLREAEKLAKNDNYLKNIIDTYKECVAREVA